MRDRARTFQWENQSVLSPLSPSLSESRGSLSSFPENRQARSSCQPRGCSLGATLGRTFPNSVQGEHRAHSALSPGGDPGSPFLRASGRGDRCEDLRGGTPSDLPASSRRLASSFQLAKRWARGGRRGRPRRGRSCSPPRLAEGRGGGTAGMREGCGEPGQLAGLPAAPQAPREPELARPASPAPLSQMLRARRKS